MQTVTSMDGTEIAFYRSGEGPPLVLVDGAIAHRAINPGAAELTTLLASDFTVVSYDRRGRGESGDTQPYAPAREVEDLAAVIAACGGSAFVVGGSSGSVLALDAAAAGLPIEKLALYEPPFICDDSRPPVPAGYRTELESLITSGDRGAAVRLFMMTVVGLPAEYLEPMVSDPSFTTLEDVAHTLAYDAAIMGETMSGSPLPADRWSAVTVPTLVIDGSESEPFIHAGADALAAILGDARRRTLDGQAHDVSADALGPALEAFLGQR